MAVLDDNAFLGDNMGVHEGVHVFDFLESMCNTVSVIPLVHPLQYPSSAGTHLLEPLGSDSQAFQNKISEMI